MAQGHTLSINLKHNVSGPLLATFSRITAALEESFNQTAAVTAELEATKEQLRRAQNEKAQVVGELEQLRGAQATARKEAEAPPVARPTEERAARQDMGRIDRTFELLGELKDHTQPVHSVAFDHQSKGVLASASWDASVKLYNLMESGTVVRSLDGQSEPGDDNPQGLYAVAFAKLPQHSNLLGCTSCDHSVYLWDHTQGKIKHRFKKHTNEVNGLDFHAMQPVMATASDDCSVIVWDFAEGIVLRELNKGHQKAVYGCRFLGTQEYQYLVATCCFDLQTRIWDMRCRSVVAHMQNHTDDVIGVDFTQNRGLLATGSDDGKICLYDARTWTLQQTINTRSLEGLGQNEVKRVAFGPDGKLLAAACSTGRALVYDAAESRASCVAHLTGHTDCVFDVAWQRSEKNGFDYLASASHDHTVRYWRRRF